MKGFVWRWMVALCVFPEIIVAAEIYRPTTNEMKVTIHNCSASSKSTRDGLSDSDNCNLLFDGNHGTFFSTRYDDCTATTQSHISFFLQQSYVITKMVLYPQDSCCGDRMQDVQVIFDGEVVDRVPGERKTPFFVTTTRSRETQNVTLYRAVTQNGQCGTKAYPSIMLYELQIYSCKQKYWGDKCETCGKGCENTCNALDGTCNCKVGWKPPRCEACREGKWDQECDKNCADQCAECKDSASNCLGCSKDYYGANCKQECSKTCTGRDLEGYCDNTTGQCLKGCIEKYWGDKCETSCPQNCQGPCNKTNGKCEGCIEKYWGDYCNMTCPTKCRLCNKTNGQCEGCLKDYWGANCTHECSKTCTGRDLEGYCDNTTGQCLKGCREKYWGDYCNNTCPPNCQGPCNKTDGKCEGCSEKYWGDTCEKTCPTNCRPCKKTSGKCEETPPPTSPPPTAASPPSEKKFPMWAAALIALGILGLIALVAFLVWRKRRQAQGPAEAPEGGPNENPEGEEPEGEGEMSSQAEESAEVAEESQQASEGGEAAPAE